MANSLREELASLKIERRESSYRPEQVRAPRRGSGLGWLSVLVWLLPLGLIGAAGTYGYLQYDRIKPKVKVSVGQVQAMTTGEAETLLSAKGYIKSVNQAMIGAKMPGRIQELRVREGDKVRGPHDGQKGQVLAVLEHEELKAQLAQRQAMKARTEAELKEARDDYELKDLKARRRTQLGSRGTVTGEELEQYVYERKTAASKIEALQASLALQEAMIAETASQIEDMFVRAPFDGTVTEKGAEVGETILLGGMGAASGRGSVATLADLDNLEVETDIAENLLSRVVIGQPAEISVTAVPQKHYRGKLSRIIPMGDRTRGTVKVRVKILDPDEHLFPELVATVHFLPDAAVNNPNAGKTFLFAPKAAILEEAGHVYAWVVDPRGRASRRTVEVVASGDDLVRVEKGLNSGESVVLNPPRTLREGQTVQVEE
jgi:RND family efflux transporter MFP subunit